ncbi:electron transporter RnfD [Candidatus Magnetomorum sp. HK-1]|nr:electron transporter RnfD [Candidatus Magnetomorum sp. HK-1]
MSNAKKFVVSHAPFWHNGDSITARSYHTMIAALPALLFGISSYGVPAARVIALSIACAMLWELGMNYILHQEHTISNGSSAVIGLLLGMLLPATAPWWIVAFGTFLAVIVGREIFGGIGANPFNPVLSAVAIIMLSWPDMFDYYGALVNYNPGYSMIYPLEAVKFQGVEAVSDISILNLLIGKQAGGIGATCGIGLLIGGAYLIYTGVIRWEISASFIVGLLITAHLFYSADPTKYACPGFHLLTGYTLIGAFFLATEDATSPVNFIPMLIYGAGAGFLTILIRNIGAYVDGVVFAILLMNLANPLIDRLRPKPLGKVKENA